MSVGAIVKDGKLVESTAQASQAAAKDTKATGPKGYDKDAFMQILVAQMKYQDPLEPTSNTEYISQYATFSELEQMQNMSGSLNLSRASETVGKEVIIETRNDSGETKTIQGYVEKVVYNKTKAFLSIDGSLYSIDDLKQVIDDEYLAGTNAIKEIKKIVDKLPKVEFVTLNEVGNILTAFNYYNALTDYQESLIDKDLKEKLDEYGKKAEELISEAAEKAALEEEEQDEPENLDELFEDSESEEA